MLVGDVLVLLGEVCLKGTGQMKASLQIEGVVANRSNDRRDRGGGKTEVLLSRHHLMKIEMSWSVVLRGEC